MRSHRRVLVGVLLLGLSLSASSVFAEVEINQSTALAGGVSVGDAPGFPVTLSSGSYRLTGDLLVARGNAIEVTGDRVTLDLNGFSIQGGAGSGIGITVGGTGAKTELAISNGTISNMRGGGIDFRNAARCQIENMRLLGATGTGFTTGIGVGELCQVKNNVIRRYSNCIEADNGSIVSGNTIQDCVNNGILIGTNGIVGNNTIGASTSPGGNVGILTATGANGVTIRGNTVTNQKNGGIVTDSGEGMLVLENTVRDTTNAVGLLLQPNSGYCNNVLTNNNGGNANSQVSGGIELCPNLCGTHTGCSPQ